MFNDEKRKVIGDRGKGEKGSGSDIRAASCMVSTLHLAHGLGVLHYLGRLTPSSIYSFSLSLSLSLSPFHIRCPHSRLVNQHSTAQHSEFFFSCVGSLI